MEWGQGVGNTPKTSMQLPGRMLPRLGLLAVGSVRAALLPFSVGAWRMAASQSMSTVLRSFFFGADLEDLGGAEGLELGFLGMHAEDSGFLVEERPLCGAVEAQDGAAI